MQDKKCAYRLCGKPIEQGKEVTGKLTLIHGAQLKHEERDYCCVRCASYDQMAHES
ncbi:YdaE family protein [Kluyvera ascorbata]|uniref:YdaE family protein n=1 Tax=Kluyvera ascorbata TaxID=51288 RepID=UPI002ABA3854|nr:YdaE family protein [Kluyvera ascorbata]MDZ4033903.1 YdaE family protein [Kluyvera ascorbata]